MMVTFLLLFGVCVCGWCLLLLLCGAMAMAMVVPWHQINVCLFLKLEKICIYSQARERERQSNSLLNFIICCAPCNVQRATCNVQREQRATDNRTQPCNNQQKTINENRSPTTISILFLLFSIHARFMQTTDNIPFTRQIAFWGLSRLKYDHMDV